MESEKKVINYYAGAPVPKYLNKIPKDAEMISLIYCSKNVKEYDVDYEDYYEIDYSFLNDYKNLKSIFLYNWGEDFVGDNIIYLLENDLLKFPKTLRVLSFYFYSSTFFKSLKFLKDLHNLEFLVINTLYTKENISYLPDNILYMAYDFNIEDVENITEALNSKLKNLKKIFMDDCYEKTEKTELKFNEFVKILKEKKIEIISEYDDFEIDDLIINMFENVKQEVNYINITREDDD